MLAGVLQIGKKRQPGISNSLLILIRAVASLSVIGFFDNTDLPEKLASVSFK
jgi:ABC-type arginine transport system permease subunit